MVHTLDPAAQTSFDWLVPEDDGMAAIPLAFDPRAVFGRARPPVVVALGGYSYRSTVAIKNGRTFIPLRRSHREAARLCAGDTVRVTLTLDLVPRKVALPADLEERLAIANARSAWDGLSFTRRRELVQAIETAKRPDTREKRIAAALAAARP